MHIEYAADLYLYNKNPKYSTPTDDQRIVEIVSDEKKILDLADGLGDAKITSIAATIREIKGYTGSKPNKYRNVTHAQRFAIAKALLTRYSTALAVLAMAYGVSEEVFLSNAGK